MSEISSTTETRVEELITLLYDASEKYYQGDGDSPLSDVEFDSLREELEELSRMDDLQEKFKPGSKGYLLLENEPALGTKVLSSETIEHLAPMLSLGKAKTENELTAWVKKMRGTGAENFKLQAKLDGFALSAVYNNGELQHLATRGDGRVGENVTYLLYDVNATVLGLPEKVEDDSEFEVRGEVFFTDEQFHKVNVSRKATTGEEFKNSRNAVVGLMKKAKQGLEYPVDFTYCVYALYQDGELHNLETEVHPGFITVQQLTTEQAPTLQLAEFSDDEELYEAVKEFGEARKNFTIPTDGVVIKPSNEGEMNKKLGTTSHHPVSQIAYKYPGESAITEVVNIMSTVGKTGKVTPVAEVRPVLVAGSVVQYITCNNFNWLTLKDVRVGSTVRIRKANDVIPEIQYVISSPEKSEPTPTPTHCPICNSLLIGSGDGVPPRTLRCMNEECEERQLSSLISSVGKTYLDVDGLSTAVVVKLFNSGRVRSLADLYTLTVEELQELTFGISQKTGNPIKIGTTRAANIIHHIEVSKNHPLPRLLASLNIEGLGRTTAKLLVKHYSTLTDLQNATIEDLAQIHGLSVITAEKIVDGLQRKKPLIDAMMKNGVKFGVLDGEETPVKDDVRLDGLSFSISGAVPPGFANRAALVEYIEVHGGEFHSSPKTGLKFMIGDVKDTSSKVVKARNLGVEFITPEEFSLRFFTGGE